MNQINPTFKQNDKTIQIKMISINKKNKIIIQKFCNNLRKQA